MTQTSFPMIPNEWVGYYPVVKTIFCDFCEGLNQESFAPLLNQKEQHNVCRQDVTLPSAERFVLTKRECSYRIWVVRICHSHRPFLSE